MTGLTAELILCLFVAGFALGISGIALWVVCRRTNANCDCGHMRIDHVADGCTAHIVNRRGHVHRCRCAEQWGYTFERGQYL